MELNLIKKNTMAFIMKYSIPAIVAMVLTSMVTVVDGFFISSYIGEEALASMNLGIPILYIFLAVGIMIGVGGVSIAGRRLGEQLIEKSINVFNQTVVTGVVAFVSLALIVALLIRPLVTIVGLDNHVVEIMLSYYRIMIWVYPFLVLNIVYGMFLRGEGKHSLFMFNTIITTFLNILLDYILIVRFNMGLQGAAMASGVAVLTGTIIMTGYFLSKKTLFSFKKFTFEKSDLKETLYNGSSELIGQLSLSITMLFMNYVILKRLGLMGVASMSIIGYSRYIIEMIIIGFGQGISPMISYSYGAEAFDVGEKLRKQTSKLVLGLGIVSCLALFIGGHVYGSIFTDDPKLIEMIAFGMKLFSLSFLFMGYNIISSFYFTGNGYAKESIIISSLRGLIILSFNIFVLPILFGNVGIWLIAVATEGLTLLVTLKLINKTKRKMVIIQNSNYKELVN